MPSKKLRPSISLNGETHRKLLAKAKRMGISAAGLTTMLVEEWLDANERKFPPKASS